MGVNQSWGLEGVLAKLTSPLRKTGLAIALAAGLFGSTEARAEWAPPTNTTLSELNGSVSRDGRTIYFSTGGVLGNDIWYATRTDIGSPWVNPTNLAEVNSPLQEANPFISNDEKTLYFASERNGGWDIYYATRTDASSPFSTPQPLIEANSPASENMGSLSCDERTMYFSSDRTGGVGFTDIYVATRPDTGSPFGTPTNLTEVNSSDYETGGFISEDDLELYFTKQQSGANEDLYRATRPDASSPFSAPVQLTELNTPLGGEKTPSISFDGTELHYTSNVSGRNMIWKTVRATGTGNCDFVPPTEDCTDGKWSVALPITELNTPGIETNPSVSKDGRTLYWDSGFSVWKAQRPNTSWPFAAATELTELRGFERPDLSADGLGIFLHGGALNLYSATRPSVADPFNAPVPVTELNSAGGGSDASLSLDGLVLVYGNKRGSDNLWWAERTATTQPFGAPQEINGFDPTEAYTEWAPAISASGLQLYFTSNKDTVTDGHLYVAERRRIGNPWISAEKVQTPVRDTNGDYLPESQGPAISKDGTELFFYVWQTGTNADLYRVLRCPNEVDQDLDGQTLAVDCNDLEPLASTGAEEVCDFVDNDCDGSIDGMVRPGEVSPLPVNIDFQIRKPGNVIFSWQNLGSCASAYNIYEGRIGNFYGHSPLECHLTTAVPSPGGRLEFTPSLSLGSRYYLITASNAIGEGTSGFASDGVERNPSRNVCGPF